MNSFKGLEHRQELIYKKKNLTIINDSKATSFEATKFALQKYDNIFDTWRFAQKKMIRLNLAN